MLLSADIPKDHRLSDMGLCAPTLSIISGGFVHYLRGTRVPLPPGHAHMLSGCYEVAPTIRTVHVKPQNVCSGHLQ
jgi:hypothetical protein